MSLPPQSLNCPEAALLLEKIKAQVLLEWETRCRERVPAAQAQDRSALRDSLPEFLDQLVVTLSSPDSKSQEKSNSEVAQAHGEDRADQPEYTLDEVIYEYHILRTVLIELLEAKRPLESLSRKAIHKFIDFGIRKAAVRFTELVTEKQLSQQATSGTLLKESEAKFRTIADSMPQMVWSSLPDGHHDYFNKRWYEFTGVEEGATDGHASSGLLHPDDRQRAREVWKTSLATGKPYEMEYRLKHHSGQYRWTLGRALPVRNESGQITKWMGTCTDIEEIRQTAVDLANAVRVRDEFLSIASHELKTPLTSLKLQTQIVRRGIERGDSRVYSEEQVKKMVEQSDRQVMRLTRLIDDMLDVARIRSGKLTLVKENFDLCRLVSETTERLKSLFISEGCGEPEVLSCEKAFGMWDKMRIEQVLTNLMTNAIRYGKGKLVSVKVESLGESVKLSVEDQGIGLAQESLKKVFERFERAVPENEAGGLGLGLFIARQIVEAHGGKIWAESGGLGLGSKFLVTLPTGS